jgi:hypothetical protein
MNKLKLVPLMLTLLTTSAFAQPAARHQPVSRPVAQVAARSSNSGAMKKTHRRAKLGKNRRANVKPTKAAAASQGLRRLRARHRAPRFPRPRA